MALFSFLKSSLLSKVVMAVTGVMIVGFVTGHMIGNLQMYIGPEAFNKYADFLQSLGELLWVERIVMAIALILHIITSIRLTLENNAAKPVKYRVKRYVVAKLTSRTMIWTGLMIAAFVVYHLLHFTVGTIDAANHSHNMMESYGPQNLFERPNAYLMVIKGFQQPLISVIYIVGVILMGFHLSHAIQSMFQTLGLNHPKYNNFFRKIGPVWSTLVVLGFISLPISVLLHILPGGAL